MTLGGHKGLALGGHKGLACGFRQTQGPVALGGHKGLWLLGDTKGAERDRGMR